MFSRNTNVIYALPAVDAPAPLETLTVGLTSAACSHAALARLATLRTLVLYSHEDESPPSAADAAALLEVLAGLKGVLVLFHQEKDGLCMEWQLRPSDPLQLAGLAGAFVLAHPALNAALSTYF